MPTVPLTMNLQWLSWHPPAHFLGTQHHLILSCYGFLYDLLLLAEGDPKDRGIALVLVPTVAPLPKSGPGT